jgi:predicted enzyme related to lactoylglutathione lyase
MAHGDVAWTELFTRDVSRAKQFYGEVFGWTYDSFVMEGYEYTVAKTPEAAVVGISPVEVGPVNTTQAYWLSTVEVDDVDAAVATAAGLGAAIIQQPKDVPNIGRFAVMRDPNGAAIAMLQSAPPDEAEAEEGN